MNAQRTRLNLISGKIKPVINVNQYDRMDDALVFDIFDGNVPFIIPDGMSVAIMGTKADNTGFSYPARVTGESEVTANLTQQMTVFEGEVECELRFVHGNLLHGTLNFILNVERAALKDDTVISETELPMIEKAAELADKIDGYVADIEADVAHVDAVKDAVDARAEEINDAIDDANTAAQNAQDIAYEVQGKLDRGEFKGDKGDKGDAGVSPEVTVSDIAGGHRVTITDEAHPSGQDFDVMNGRDATGTVIDVTLTAAGWTGTAAPYSQTVQSSVVTATSSPEMNSNVNGSMTAEQQNAYIAAYAIVSQGYAETADGSITFYAWDKPTTDISVSLRGL